MLQTNKKIEIANLEREKKSKETTEMAQLLANLREEEIKWKEAEEEAEKKKRQAKEAEKKKEATEAARKKTRERIKFLEVKTFWLRSKIIT